MASAPRFKRTLANAERNQAEIPKATCGAYPPNGRLTFFGTRTNLVRINPSRVKAQGIDESRLKQDDFGTIYVLRQSLVS
jgi:hypothetical protein